MGPRDELAALQFPPADEELIRWLTDANGSAVTTAGRLADDDVAAGQRRSPGGRTRAQSAPGSAGDQTALVTWPSLPASAEIAAPAAGTAVPSNTRPTSRRATRPCPRCSTRMITSWPT